MVTYITYKKNKTTQRPVCQIERGAIQPGGQVGRLDDIDVGEGHLMLMLMSLLLLITLSLFMTMAQDMWEDVKMRVPALAPSNLGGACNIMKVQVLFDDSKILGLVR